MLLVTVTFLAGVGVTLYKRARVARLAAASPIVVAPDTTPTGSAGSSTGARLLDINRATARELEGLPGIGPTLAGRIVDYRQRKGGFQSINELKLVPGIGPKRFAALKDMVTIGEPAPAVDSGR